MDVEENKRDIEDFVGKQLRRIIKTPTERLAHILGVDFQTAKLIQGLITDFLKTQE